MGVSKFFSLGFLRAVSWSLLMVSMGLVVTLIQLLAWLPAWLGLDPNYWLAQRLVSLLASTALWPFAAVQVKVRP